MLLTLLVGCDSAAEDARDGKGPATALDGCPAPPDFAATGTDKFDEPYADLPSTVPSGAVAARICPGGGLPMEYPQDVLETGIADLVDVINGGREQENGACTADLSYGYRILFDYDDGSTFLVSAGFYGCESVVVGSVYRDGPAEVLRTFQDLDLAQREEREPPSPPVAGDLTCWGRGSPPEVPPIGEPDDAVRAVLCRTEYRNRVVYYSAPIGREDLRILLDDIADRRVSGRIRCTDRASYSAIVATTAWGDRVLVAGECRPGAWINEDRDEVWRPGGAAGAILDRLLSETRRVQ